jgi:hypothetical protein
MEPGPPKLFWFPGVPVSGVTLGLAGFPESRSPELGVRVSWFPGVPVSGVTYGFPESRSPELSYHSGFPESRSPELTSRRPSSRRPVLRSYGPPELFLVRTHKKPPKGLFVYFNSNFS